MTSLSREEKIYFMNRALELARIAETFDEVPVGAILVQENHLVAEGGNLRETEGRVTAHAEVIALESLGRKTASWRVKPDTSIFVTVEPCLMCVGALLWARVDHVYFACEDTRNAGLRRISELIKSGVYDHRFKTMEQGILKEEASSLMSEYFRKKRK